jgi:hypothetical protein
MGEEEPEWGRLVNLANEEYGVDVSPTDALAARAAASIDALFLE